VTVTHTRKCDRPFKLQGKLIRNGKYWVSKVIYGIHDHEMVEMLLRHPCANKLKPNEYFMVVDIIKSIVKLLSILVTLKENNEENVTILKQVYYVRYANKKSLK